MNRILGPGADVDLPTDARPAETKQILGDWPTRCGPRGSAWGTIGAKKGGRRFEITTHRAEPYTPNSRKPEVKFGDEIEADLARRDFTVNAMALALPEPRLIDPFEGAVDLAAKRLRTPLSPEESFSEDPLRSMRAARFIARYDVAPDDEIVL